MKWGRPKGGQVALGPQVSDLKETLLASIATEVVSCQNCKLGATRTKAVPGVGSAHAHICFVGEGPGREEDMSGVPFVGQAGRLLDRMLVAEGLSRKECYICNIVKCRPPNNRVPEPSEVAACSLYLYAQLAVVEPDISSSLAIRRCVSFLANSTPSGRCAARFWSRMNSVSCQRITRLRLCGILSTCRSSRAICESLLS